MNWHHLLSISVLMLLPVYGLLGQEVVEFRNRPAEIQDQVTQSIECHLNAERAIRQHKQVIDKSKQQFRRDQVRTVRVLQVSNGNATQALIQYEKSSTKIAVENGRVVEANQPVAGKTYLVERKQQELIIRSEKGLAVSEEEDQILRTQLQTFGLPNPLAQFLNGKRIRIGQSVDVPEEVARELLGLTGNNGKTDKLALRLSGMRSVSGTNCAVFETLLKSHSDESSISLLMKGELLIDPATCHTKTIELEGPVAISELRGPPEGRFMVSTNGSLKVAVRTARQIPVANRTTIRR